VIFNGGTSDFVSACVLDGDPSIFGVCAEDFQFVENEILNDVHLDVLQSDPSFTAEFTYVIYADNGGMPDGTIPGIILAGQGVNEHKMLIAGAGPGDFRYWFDLDNPPSLLAGTTYWIQLQVTNSPSPLSIFWYTTTPGFGNPASQTFDPTFMTWDTTSFHLNLVLTGPSPDTVIGGELLPINNTALLLAGLQSSAIWMLPVVVGSAGVGTYYIKTRMNKD